MAPRVLSTSPTKCDEYCVPNIVASCHADLAYGLRHALVGDAHASENRGLGLDSALLSESSDRGAQDFGS